ncbi:MFS general substrate transporter [Penicillium longicatenatum]|nr:MFS general substrate transporter [Penicillium longicatenatum]
MLGQLSGLAIGLSVTGALFTNLAKINLQTVFPNVDESTLISIAAATSGGILETQSDAKPKQALIAIVDALHDILIEVYVVAGLAVVLGVFLKVLLPNHCGAQANKNPVEKGIHRRFCWRNVVI